MSCLIKADAHARSSPDEISISRKCTAAAAFIALVEKRSVPFAAGRTKKAKERERNGEIRRSHFRPIALYPRFIASPFVPRRSLPALPVSHAVEHAPPPPGDPCTCVRTTSGKPESILIVGTTPGIPLRDAFVCHGTRARLRATTRAAASDGNKVAARKESARRNTVRISYVTTLLIIRRDVSVYATLKINGADQRAIIVRVV